LWLLGAALADQDLVVAVEPVVLELELDLR
jgi:hypothetical protein